MLATLLTVVVVGVAVTVSAALYFLPLLVAALRRAPDLGPVAVLNVFLGWTLVGWVVALALALRTERQQGQVLQLVQNLPAPPRGPILRPLPPSNEAPTAQWSGPPGPPPARGDGPPPLFVPPDFPEVSDWCGPLGEE